MKIVKTYEDFCNEEINWKKAAVGVALGASMLGGISSCKKNRISPIYMTIKTSGYDLVSYKDNCSSTNDDEINSDLVKSWDGKKSRKYQISSGTYNFEYLLDEIDCVGKYTGYFTIINNNEKEPISWTFYLGGSYSFLSQYGKSSIIGHIEQLPDTVLNLPNGSVTIKTKKEIIEKN